MSDELYFLTKGDIVLLKWLRDTIRGQKPNSPNDRSPRFKTFHAKVRTSGPKGTEADYSDERYWFEVAYVSNTDKDTTTALSFTALASNDPLKLVGTASNIAESLTHAHSLTEGQPIDVSPLMDAQGTVRYFFTSGGAGSEMVCPYQFMARVAVAQNSMGCDFPGRLHPAFT